MADNSTKIVITAQDNASAQLAKVSAGVKGLGDTSERVKEKLGGLGDPLEQAGQKASRAEKQIVGALQREIAALKAGANAGAEFQLALAAERGLNPAAFEPYIKKLSELRASQQNAAQSVGAIGASAKQTAAALRGVPAQFTDIITSLQGGQAPLTVFLQQGGQLRDMFGGAGAAARALGGYVVGLINPFMLAAAGAAGLAVAYNQGANESQAYSKALILSGNAAATTASQLAGMAVKISDTTGATKGAAAEALTALAQTGAVTGSNLQAAAAAAVRMKEAAGVAIADTVKQFEELGRSPVAASEKLNQQYNYLTASVYKQIKALEGQGRTSEAAALAQKTYADALVERSKQIEQNLGLLEGGWKLVANEAKRAWDFMLGVGREKSLEDKLTEARIALNSAKAGVLFSGSVEDRQAEVNRIQAQIDAEKRLTDEKRKANEQNQAAIAWEKEADKYLNERARLEKEIDRIRRDGKKAGASQEDINTRVAKAREDYDKAVAGANSEALINAAKGHAKRYSDFYKQELENFQLSTEQYVLAIAALERNALETEKKAVQGQKPKTDAERITQKAKLTELQQQIDDIDNKSKAMLEDAARHSQEVLVQMAAAAGKTLDPVEQAQRDFAARWGKEMKRAMADGNEAVVTAGRDLQAAMVNDAQFKSAKQKYDEIFAELERRLEEVKATAAADGGLLAGIGAAAESDRIRSQFMPALQDARAEMERVAGTSLVNQKTVEETKRNLVKVTEEGNQAWRRFADQIEQSLTDSLMRGFENGKSFAKNFIDSIKNTLKTAVLRIGVQAVVDPIMGGVRSMLSGGSTLASIGSATNAASGANSLWNLANGGMTAPGSAYYNFATSSLGQTLGLGTSLAAATWNAGIASGVSALGTGTAVAGLGTGTSVAGLSATAGSAGAATAGLSTIGAALPYVGAALAVGSALGLFGGHGDDPHNNPDQTMSGLDLILSRAGITSHYANQNPGMQIAGPTSGSGWWAEYHTLTQAQTDEITKAVAAAFKVGDTLASKLGVSSSVLDSVRTDSSTDGTPSNGKVGGVFTTLDQAITALTDKMAVALVPSIKDFQASGESLTQTLTRVVSDVSIVKDAFGAMGKTFTATGDDAAKLAETIASQFGGSGVLQSAWSDYYQNFYAESERTARATDQIKTALADLGLAMPNTREEFRRLVEAQDLTTESGRKMFAALVGLSSSFASITPQITAASDAARSALSTASSNLTNAYARQLESYQAELSAKQDFANKMRGYVASLRDFGAQLLRGNSAPTTAEDQYAAAKSAFEDVSRRAALGDTAAIDQLQQVSNDFLTAAQANAKSVQDYARDFGLVQAALNRTSDVAQRQADVAQQQVDQMISQIDATNAQIAVLKDNTTSIVSLGDAMRELQQAIISASAAGVRPSSQVAQAAGIYTSGAGATYNAASDTWRAAGMAQAETGITTGALANVMRDIYSNYGGETLLAKSKEVGISLSDIDRIAGLPPGTAEEFARSRGIASFDVGTSYVPRTGLALIHEGEAIIPRGDNNATMADVFSEIRSLREQQKAVSEALAISMAEIAKINRKWDGDGLPATRVA